MTWQEKLTALHNAGSGIYEDLPSKKYFLTAKELESALNKGLRGLSLGKQSIATVDPDCTTEYIRTGRHQ